MHYYPVNLNISGRKCAVLGGGSVAARKVQSLLAAGAGVTVISPALTAVLQALAASGKIVHQQTVYRPGLLAGYFLVLCATDDAAVNKQAAAEAKQLGVLVNVVDDPSLCDFTVPAQVRRGELLLTVSTGGASPAFARKIRQELERRYGPEYGSYLNILAKVRAQLKASGTVSERGRRWRELIDEEVLDYLQQGKVQEAEEKIWRALGSIRFES